MASSPSEHRPTQEAVAKSVEDLVALVRRGYVRVPSFQRRLNWDASDVVMLFDSIYRGYPIGSPLLWEGGARAERLTLGPLKIDAPETKSALWVVDGQQRFVSLTAALYRPDPYPTAASSDDPYVVYFDPAERKFHAPRREEDIGPTWVPVSRLADSADLSEWIFTWRHASDRKLRSALFEAGRNLREYRVPLYIVRTEDVELLHDIFYRVNTSGKELKWTDVHKALFADQSSEISTLGDLAEELARLEMGTPDTESQLLPCLLGIRGRDVTRNLAEHYQNDPDVLRGAVSEALPVLRRTFSFLRRDAQIPHLRLLPRSAGLIILSRFFALHPEPKSRTISLLVRWLWRSILSPGTFDDRTLRRRGIAAVIDSDEEASVQGLLSLVASEPPRVEEIMPAAFDARAAGSRVVLLALASAGPRDLESHQEIDVSRLINSADTGAFRKIVYRCAGEQSPSNRIIHQGYGTARQDIVRHMDEYGSDTPVLRSHVIFPEAAKRLTADDIAGFLEARTNDVRSTIVELGARLARWGSSDRPSIEYILRQAEGDQP